MAQRWLVHVLKKSNLKRQCVNKGVEYKTWIVSTTSPLAPWDFFSLYFSLCPSLLYSFLASNLHLFCFSLFLGISDYAYTSKCNRSATGLEANWHGTAGTHAFILLLLQARVWHIQNVFWEGALVWSWAMSCYCLEEQKVTQDKTMLAGMLTVRQSWRLCATTWDCILSLSGLLVWT